MSELVNLAHTTVVKAANAFCVALQDGRLPLAGDHPLGLYQDDCRHLRGCELRINGCAPRLLVGSDAAGTGAIFELTNPDLPMPDGGTLLLQSLRIRVERRIRPSAMVDRITLRSYAHDPVALDLEVRLDADFRSMLEVRGIVELSEREVELRGAGDTLRFSAVGRDGRERATAVSCTDAIADARTRCLRATVELEAGEERTLELCVLVAGDPGHVGPQNGSGEDHSSAAAEADAWLADRLRIEVDDDLVERVLRRSLLDLRMLASDLDGQRYYAAGVPWYATLFGRDSIVTALEVLTLDHAMAEDTLRLLAGRLGQREDPEHDEEPGKVIHELRVGEIAARGASPFARYYGTVDATPLFLCLLCEHADWAGSLDLFRELRPEIELALRWIDEFGDLDGDGLLEYRTRSSAGLVNQGWKDSWDGIVDERGDPLVAPIAVVEAQGYAMRAKRRLAYLFELDGDPERATRLREEAAAIARELERFWLPDEGFYAMALDADKRPSRVLASNQGHLLWALAVPPERAAAVRDALMGEGAYSGWGVRTLSASERAFNPVGYHTGTVWPHDNAFFAMGLRKYGFDEAFVRVLEDMLDAAASFHAYRLPELFAGFSRADYEDPIPYPVACSPQAWAAGALPSMITAGLGLVPDGLNRKLRVRRPTLPRHVDRLTIQGLRIADARVDLRFERVGGRSAAVALTDARIDGDVEVLLEIPPTGVQVLAPKLDDVLGAPEPS
jgi:glycogen debranching enzyme